MAKQIAFILIALLIIAAVFIFVWKIKAPTSTPSPGEITQKVTAGPTLKKETKEIPDCGTISSVKSSESEQAAKCWEEKFKNCQQAKVVMNLNLPNSEPIVYYSEIIGPGEGEHICQVKSKFLNNPNPEWINKEMICNYDNSLSFDVASQDMPERCSGPLIDLLKTRK